MTLDATGAGMRRTGVAPLLALTLPMLPGVLAGQQLQTYRPWFWAEFFLLALLTRGRSWAFALSLALLWGADFLFAFAQVNLSSSYLDVLELLSYVPYTNRGWIVAGLLGLVALILFGALCVRLHRLASPGRGMLLWALLLLGLTLVLPAHNGFDHPEGRLYRIQSAKLAGSWVLDSAYARQSLSFYEEGYAPDSGKFREVARDGSAVRRAAMAGDVPEKMLLVVVESWGVSTNAGENQFWQALWESPAWTQETGVLSFMGATVQGEFRELCGFLPQTLRIDEVPDAAKCLPNLLRSQGWKTQSFHGASAKMYRRDEWYETLGFERSFFLPQLIKNATMCASLPGVCDYSIANRVVQTLREEGKQFTYWLSLNSHTPYRESDLSSPEIKEWVCSTLKLQGARCVHAALLYDFMVGLKSELMKFPISGLQVVLVGDHAPKFLDDQRSRLDFQEAKVPYIVLRTPTESRAEVMP